MFQTNKLTKAKKAKISAPKSQSKISDHVVTSFSSASKKRRFVEPDDNDDTSASFSPSIRRDSPDLKPQKTYPSRRSSAAATAKISMQQKSQVEDDEEDEGENDGDSSDDENRFVITRKAEDVVLDSDCSLSLGSPKLSSTGKNESPYIPLKKTNIVSNTPLAQLSSKKGSDSGNQGSISSLATAVVESSKAKKRLVMKSPVLKVNQISQKSSVLTKIPSNVTSGQENTVVQSNSPKLSKPIELSSSHSPSVSTPRKWNLRTSGVAPEVAENCYLVERSRATSSNTKQTTLNVANQRRIQNSKEPQPLSKSETTGAKRSVVRISSSGSSRLSAGQFNEKFQILMRRTDAPESDKKKDSQSQAKSLTPRRPMRNAKNSEVVENDCIVLSSASSTGSSFGMKKNNKKPVKGKKRISETETISETSSKSATNTSQRSTRSRPGTASEDSERGSAKDEASDRSSVRSVKADPKRSKVAVASRKAPPSSKTVSGNARDEVNVTPKREKLTRGRHAKILDTPSLHSSPSVRSTNSTGGTPCSRTRSRITGVK